MQRRSTFREEYRALVRERILDLARPILAREGEGAVRMNKLSEEIGVSIGSMYRYFPSRDDLIATLWLERIERIASTVDSQEAADLHALVEAWTDAACEDPQAVVKLAEALESAVTSGDDKTALQEPASLGAALVDALRLASVPGINSRSSAAWRAAVLLRVVAAVAVPPPGQPPDPNLARRSGSALIDRWIRGK
jgi:AcrR family transcriptional regulator